MKLVTSIVILLVIATLSACHDEPKPSDMTQDAPLERPIYVLPQDSNKTLLIPRSAMLERGGIPIVFVLQDGQARARMIKRGNYVGDKVEIISGLFGGESLVLGQLQHIHDGSPVSVKSE